MLLHEHTKNVTVTVYYLPVVNKHTRCLLGVQIGAITVSTDTVQQLCHSSNLQLLKSAPCTDIHGTKGSHVQILYCQLIP